MPRKIVDWESLAATVVVKVSRYSPSMCATLPRESRATAHRIAQLDEVRIVDDLGEAAFRVAGDRIELNLSGLTSIYQQGAIKRFSGLDEDAFCEIALCLFLFHEVHHITQNLSSHEDVQALKRTAGDGKLGEFDLIADAVAAQIFAAYVAADAEDDCPFGASFVAALEFMVNFCFPAFGFPAEKKHKAQRAVGIVLMLLRARSHVISGEFSHASMNPLFPYFSIDYQEIAVLEYPDETSTAISVIKSNMHMESVVDLLKIMDSGDLNSILERTRELI